MGITRRINKKSMRRKKNKKRKKKMLFCNHRVIRLHHLKAIFKCRDKINNRYSIKFCREEKEERAVKYRWKGH